MLQTLRPNFQTSSFSSATYAPPSLCNVCGQAFFAAEIAVRRCGVARGCTGLQCWISRKVALFSFLKGIGKRAEKIRLQSTPSMPCFHAFAMNDQTAYFILFYVFPIFESAVWQVHVVSCCTIRPADDNGPHDNGHHTT